MEMLKNLMETITGMGATAILPLVIFILGLVFRMKPCRDQVGHHSRYWFYWFRSGCWFIKQFITASY